MMRKLLLPSFLLITSLLSCKKDNETPSNIFTGRTYETYIGLRSGKETYHHIRFTSATDAEVSVHEKNGNLIENNTVRYAYDGILLNINGNSGTPTEDLIIVDNKTLVPGARAELTYIRIE